MATVFTFHGVSAILSPSPDGATEGILDAAT
jgi:hypothetical protein